MTSFPPSVAGQSLLETCQVPIGMAGAPRGEPAGGAHSYTPPGPSGPEEAPGVARPSAASDPLPDAADGQTFAGVPVRAIEDVMAARARQIIEFGHTVAQDRARPLDGYFGLISEVQHMAAAAREYADFGRGKREITRRKLVNAAAMALACIDWIDAEHAERTDQAQPGEPPR